MLSMHMATLPTTPAWTCAHGHGIMPHPSKTSRHHSVFSNLMLLNSRIRFVFEKFQGFE